MKKKSLLIFLSLVIAVSIVLAVGAGSKVKLVTNGGTNDGDVLYVDKLNDLRPTKAGYEFNGWYLDNNLSVPVTGDLFQSGRLSGKEVFASWNVVNFTVTYHINGGEIVGDYPVTYTVQEGIVFPIPQRDNYTFNGWYDNKDFYGTADAGIETGSVGNVDVYAKWIPYDIIYSNAAVDELPIGSPMTYDGTSDVILPAPQRTGFAFQGWFNNSALSGTSIAKIVAGSSGSKIFYAKWALAQYSITYDLGGGTHEGNPPAINIEQTIELKAARKSGYRFMGWFIFDENANEEDYANTNMILTGVSHDIQLVAKWEPQNYTITYNLDGGQNDLANPSAYNITLENDIILKAPTKAGFVFVAWLDAQNSSVTRIAAGSVGNLYLYASWQIINYNVTYYSNNGSVDARNLPTYNVMEGFTLHPIVRTDYVFKGWYLNNVFDGAAVEAVPVSGMPLDDISLYAKFLQAYRISYVLGSGGINSQNNPEFYTQEDEVILYPAARNGFAFREWNTSSDGSGESVISIPSGGSSAVTLYAIWDVLSYDISYNLNGGNLQGTAIESYTVIDAVNLPQAERTGYSFAGWCQTEALTDPPITSLENSTGNKVLYAKWVLVNYKIIYNGMEEGSNNNPDTYTYEDEITLVPAVRTGYEFLGWYAEGTYQTLVTAISLHTSGEINLYAKFATLYPIVYELNGGAHIGNVPTHYTGLSDIALGEASRAGHRFYGWYSTADFSSGRIYSIPSGSSGAVHLYARFAILYTVSYDANGGTATENPESYTALDESYILQSPTRKGASFMGWKNEDGTVYTEIAGGLQKNLALTAQWDFIQYNITYHLFGGTNNENNVGYYTYEWEVQIFSPTKDIHTFRNWYLDAEFNTLIKSLPPEGEPRAINLYARFVPNNEIYQVEYEDIFDADNRNNPAQYTTDSNELLAPITRAGYTFLRWEHNGEPISTLLGKVGNITVKAVWQPIPFAINYVTDGGNKGENPGSYTTDTGLLLLPGVKLHYDFEMWYLDEEKTQSISQIQPGALGEITLYAAWTLTQYEINYSLGDGFIVTEYYTLGAEDYELTPGVKDAATFVSWHTDPDGLSQPVERISTENPANIVFYAKWIYTAFTLRYELNGGVYNPAPQYKKTSYTVEETVALAMPTREGYTFVGWYVFDVSTYPLERLVAEKKYIVGYTPPAINHVTANNYYSEMATVSYPATAINAGNGGSRVFYAKWSSESYNIAYALNGGVNSSSNPLTYTKDDNITLYGASRAGYTFIGWYRTADFNERVTKLPLQDYVGNIQIFARFERTYSINYNLDGNSGFATGVPNTYTVADNEIILAEPAKTNYIFFGWYTDMTYSTQVTAINLQNYNTLANASFVINLYPKFLQRYEIVYNLYSSENSEQNPLFYTEESNITLAAAEKEGYYFKGWYTHADVALGRNVEHINSSDPAFRTRYILHAIFLPITYVTYVPNGGANPLENPTWFTSEHNYGAVLLPAERTGYDFLGWYATSNFTTDRITTLTNTSVTTLYARWQPKIYTIEFSFDGEAVDTSNPTEYTIETETFTLQPYNRNYYTFNGWFSGETLLSQIPKGSYGDIALEAKYTPINYTASYNLTYQGASHNNATSFNIESSAISLTDAALAGAVFEGWYESSSYSGTRIYQIPAGTTSNRVYYAKWTLTNYTIDYELNGGYNPTTGTLNPTTYNISQGTLFVSATRPSYTFLGWYLTSDFSGDRVLSVAGRTGNILLYARFETTYFINYNLATDSMYPEVNNSLNPASFTVSSPTIMLGAPSKTYFEFDGWFASSDFSGAAVTQISSGTTGTLNLYPKWVPISYNITYVLNGGGGNSGNPSTYTVLTPNITLTSPMRDGCTFGGWFLESDLLTGISIIPQGSHGDRLMYAKWNLISYSINYENIAGATNNPSNLTSYNVETRELTLLPAQKTGYVFVGWYDASIGGYRATVASGSFGNIAVTAHWSAVLYSVEYMLHGGTNNAENPLNYTITDSYLLKNPEREHYEFDGWYDNANYTGSKRLSITASTGNLTIYAKWIPAQFDIVYNLSGGSNHLSNPAVYTVESKTILRNASLAGSNFLGWYTEPSFINKVTSLEGFTGAIVLYARFSSSHSITYHLDGGTNSEQNPSSYTSVEETPLSSPTKNGYRFDGWYNNSNFTGGSISSIPIGQTGAKVFYAKFVRVYSITYHADGGTHSNPAGFEEGTSVTLQDAVKSAFVFLGWYENTSFEGSPVTLVNGSSDVVVYAKWGEWKGYMYYGSYPQSKVLDGSLVIALDNAIASGSIVPNAKGYYLYAGYEYAPIPNSSGENDYFKVEPIKWKILSYSGGKATLIADTALEASIFNDELISNTWTESSLKAWLENVFFQSAFTQDEQGAIVSQESEQITLLDVDTATDTYPTFSDEDSRVAKVSDYALAQGAEVDAEGNCYWWLTSSGLNSEYASYIGADGKIYNNASVILGSLCVRPVIVVQLSA